MSGDYLGFTHTALYADMVRHMQAGPASARELAERHGICACTARQLTREMHTLGLIHIHAWHRAGARGPLERVFASTEGDDVPPPPTTRGVPMALGAPPRSRPRVTLIAFNVIWQALQSACTAPQLIEESGLSPQAVYRLLAHTRRIGLTHIAEWTRSNTIMVACHRSGRGPDKRRPPRMNSALVKRRCRQREAERRRMALLGGIAA